MVDEYCAMAIVIYQNKVLFTNETVGQTSRLSLPKGHIEKGESHLETAIRECQEETGVILKKSEFYKEIGSFEYVFENIFNDNKLTHKTIYPLIFKISEEKPIKITEANINYAGYMDIKDMIKVATFDNIKDVLARVIIALNN